jgi:hypothetical protein
VEKRSPLPVCLRDQTRVPSEGEEGKEKDFCGKKEN